MSVISANILILLQEQFRHEMSNYLRYTARASWARYKGLESTGDFFTSEANGELEHAKTVREFIESRNEAVIPETLTYTDSSNFAGFDELFTTALAVERETTDMLNNIYAEAINIKDFQTSVWVQALIAEQTEEENLYQKILDRIAQRGDDTGSVHDIDVWIGTSK
jgi:ferritin